MFHDKYSIDINYQLLSNIKEKWKRYEYIHTSTGSNSSTNAKRIDLQEEEYETLNGYLTSLLGHIPNIDEDKEIRANGYLFTILAVENNTIQRVRVEKLPEEKGEEKCQDIQNSQT